MQNFSYWVPTEFVFGKNAEEKVGEKLKANGYSRIFIVIGGGSVKRSGLLDRVTKSLEDNGIVYEVFAGAVPNPTLEHALEGVELAKAFAPNFILAVGGGSAIDTAKGIAHGTANPDLDLWDIFTAKVTMKKSMPIGSVLTIPAAGSESSNSAVLTNMKTFAKVGLTSQFNVPRLAFVNPELTFTLPKRQIINGVVDIMMHTLDRYFNSNGENEMTDGIAEAVLRTTIKNGAKAAENHQDYHVMSELMWSSSLSHNTITGLGRPRDFSVHALGRQFSGVYNCDHGATLSALWATWARYVCDSALGRFAQYARNVWDVVEADDKEAALKGIKATEDYFRSIGSPVTIKEMGIEVGEEELASIADMLTNGGKNTVGGVMAMTREDLMAIFRAANI